MAKNKTIAAKAKKKNGGDGKAKSKKDKSGAKSGKMHSGFEAVTKLADLPIVADLIAIGATAAVTAIAAGMTSKSGKTSSNAVKDAGKAAAAAIGARLMSEFQAVKDSAAAAKAKSANPKKS